MISNKVETLINYLRQLEKDLLLPYTIDELDLSTGVYHSLLRSGIKTIGDLVQNWENIQRIRNLGTKSISEIAKKLKLWSSNFGEKSESGLADETPRIQNTPSLTDEIINELLQFEKGLLEKFSIKELTLRPRIRHSLSRGGIDTIHDLVWSWSTVSQIGNIGPKSISDIAEQLHIWLSKKNELHQTSLVDAQPEISSENSRVKLIGEEYGPERIIEELDLPTRTYNILKRNNVNTLDQLTSLKLDEIRYFTGVGPTTQSQIQAAIEHALIINKENENQISRIPKDNGIIPQQNIPSKEMSIGEYITSLLDTLSSRSNKNIEYRRVNKIIEYRYGLRDGKRATLQETAEYFGVTRERIRQIEMQGLIKLGYQQPTVFPSPLFIKIKEHIDNRGGLISRTRLKDEFQNALVNTGFIAEGIVDLLSAIIYEKIIGRHKEERIIWISDFDGWSTSAYDFYQILSVAKKIHSILLNAKTPMQWAELFTALVREDGLLTLDEKLAYAVVECMSDIQQIHSHLDGSWSIGKEEKVTSHSRLISVLQQIGEPAHFSEIAKLYNQIFSDYPQTEHSIHAVISRREEFVRVGKGKYGLLEWGLYADGNVGNAIRRILVVKGRPMSLNELLGEVLKTWDVQKSAIIAAVESDARFAKTDDGLICLTEIGLTIEKRIKREDDTRLDRVEAVLRELGSPHSVNLIVKMHNMLYPDKPLTAYTLKYLMHRKPDLFMRTGRDVFGMTEWGLEPYQEEENEIASDLFEIIKEYGPLTMGTICDVFERKFPDRRMSESILSKNLEKLKDQVFNPRKGEYQVADHHEILSQAGTQDGSDPECLRNLQEVLAEIGAPAHVDYIVSGYKSLYPNENREYAEIRSTLYNNMRIFKLYSEGVFGLVSHLTKQDG